MSNLTGVIGRFAYPGTVVVTRTAGGMTDGYGRYVKGATTTFPLSPVGVVPGTSNLKTLPEGWSAENVRTLYTTTKLVKLPIPDKVMIDGEAFVVIAVQGPWTGFGGTHYVVTVGSVASPGGS